MTKRSETVLLGPEMSKMAELAVVGGGGGVFNLFACHFKDMKGIILFKIQCCLRFLDMAMSNFQCFGL